METYLDKIVNFLSSREIILSNTSRDGRLNSAANEDQIIELLKKEFGEKIDVPNARSWYDFGIIVGSEEIYVNIKISNLNNRTPDNVSSKKGMGYALTGIANMPDSWGKFNKKLIENLKYGHDYYFLVVNKKDTSDIYWTSLKRIKELWANGNNLPFQCKWADNREFSHRNEREATEYILSVYVESWRLRVKHFPDEIEDMLGNDTLPILSN